MNQKKAKKLRKKSKLLLLEWLRTMIPDGEEKDKINLDNIEQFLPEEQHVYLNNNFMLSAYSPRWFYKKVKTNPNITLEDILNGR